MAQSKGKKVTKKEQKAQHDATITNKRKMAYDQKKIVDLLKHPVTLHCTSFKEVLTIAANVYDVANATPSSFGFDPNPRTPLTREQCDDNFLHRAQAMQEAVRENIKNKHKDCLTFDEVIALPDGRFLLHAIIYKTCHIPGTQYLFMGGFARPIDNTESALYPRPTDAVKKATLAVILCDDPAPSNPNLETPLFNNEGFNAIADITNEEIDKNPITGFYSTSASGYHAFIVVPDITTIDEAFAYSDDYEGLAGMITPIGYFKKNDIKRFRGLLPIENPVDEFVANCLWWKYFGEE